VVGILREVDSGHAAAPELALALDAVPVGEEALEACD
jgi:hypothetical protein